MFCQNCGTQQTNDAHYCPQCGEQLDFNTHTDEVASEIENIELNEGDTTFEEDLMTFVNQKNSYYQQKWKKIDSKEKKNGLSFNVAAFFFTFFWLGYRKMYKTIFFIALAFLAVDLILYLVGYQYQADVFIDPIDRAIGTSVSVGLGLYGNILYRKHAEKRVLEIRNTKHHSTDREPELKRQGGRTFIGILYALLIIGFAYVLPTIFIPMNVSVVDEIKHSEFYDYPDVTIDELFNRVFDEGEWQHVDSTSDYDLISYDGIKQVDDEMHDVSIVFIDEGKDEFEVLYVVVDDEELDSYDSNDFIDYIFSEYDNQ